MGDQGIYTVPKDCQAVRIHLDQGQIIAGTIFLEYAPQDHTMHERVIAFLENGDNFFPLAVTEGAEPEFIYKGNLRMIEVEYPEQPSEFYSLMRMLPVTVQFADRMTVSGELMVDVPQEKSRLSDCLNTIHQFLCLKNDKKIYYIEKSSLCKVMSRGKDC